MTGFTVLHPKLPSYGQRRIFPLCCCDVLVWFVFFTCGGALREGEASTQPRHFWGYINGRIKGEDLAGRLYLRPRWPWLLSILTEGGVWLLLIHCLLLFPLFVGVLCWSVFCNAVLSVLSSFAIISLRWR